MVDDTIDPPFEARAAAPAVDSSSIVIEDVTDDAEKLDEEHLEEDIDITNITKGPVLQLVSECMQQFYILGTAHVSRQSCDDARALIDAVKPDLVFLELCPERQIIIQMDRSTKVPSLSSVFSDIHSGRTTAFQAIYGWFLARIGQHLDAPPGEEFRVSVHAAADHGASIVLGDRPVSITLARLWGGLGRWEKLRLTGKLLWTGLSSLDADATRRDIESLKDVDVLTDAILEIGKEYPSLIPPLITERDQYMVYVMRQLAGEARRIVAVVGAGHLKGIESYWDKDIDVEELCRVPDVDGREAAWRRRRVALRVGIAVAAVATGVMVASRWRQRR